MSNSFSPKKAPTFLNQETRERVLLALRQPFSIAVLASLGLHGVLWATLPNILAETEKVADTKQRVQVVELSPAEQSQLPSFGINQVPPTLVPTTPTKPAQSGTKLPEPNKLYSYPLDTIPVFPPPNIYPNDFSSLFPKSLPEPQTEPKKPSPAASKAKVPVPPSPPSDPKPSEPAKPATPGTNEPARSGGLSPQQQLAALQVEQRQLQALYAFNGADPTVAVDPTKIRDTMIGDLSKNAPAFENAVVNATGGNYDNSSYSKTPEKVDIPFPKEACLVMKEPFLKETKHASVGAYVSPDGKLVGKPGLLSTSGFNGLDQLAFNFVSSATFKPSSKPRLIRFDFTFDPKAVCPNAPKAT